MKQKIDTKYLLPFHNAFISSFFKLIDETLSGGVCKQKHSINYYIEESLLFCFSQKAKALIKLAPKPTSKFQIIITNNKFLSH